VQETAGLDKHTKKTKGFKNIPILNAITACYAHMCTLRVNGMAIPPEVEPNKDPQTTPGIMTKPSKHPLQHSWYIFLVEGGSSSHLPVELPFCVFESPGLMSSHFM
jgi:translation initiation factor 4E